MVSSLTPGFFVVKFGAPETSDYGGLVVGVVPHEVELLGGDDPLADGRNLSFADGTV